ncbi:MAG: SurA N-terminal domain-containing protein [Candidatus Eisenbacteria bacterium]|nr:SurA N-terminal domain-containing protein [Candidatus Eisenbacteria bacterium]
MSALRNNTKPIIWFTAVAFVIGFILIMGSDIFSGPSGNRTALFMAKVNGDPITIEAWEQALQEARTNYRDQRGTNPDSGDELRLRNQTWEGLIQDLLVRQEAARMKIKVSDSELAYAIRNQPLPDFFQHPSFQTNGRFDLSKYQAFLGSPNFDPLPLENLYRRTIPLQKVQERIMLSVRVSDEELWESFRRRDEKVRFELVHYTMGRINVPEAESGVDDAVLRKFAEEHPDRFEIPEQAELRFVKIDKVYSRDDSLEAYEHITNARDEIKDGEDYGILIDAYSEAPPSRRGGDTGIFMQQSQFTPPVLGDSIFAMGIGEISGIIKAVDGFHIVRVDSIKTEEGIEKRKVGEIFVPLRPSYDTFVEIRDRILAFADSAKAVGFNQAAEAMGLAPDSTGLFPKDGFPRKIGRIQDAIDFAFSGAVKELSRPLETAEAWYIFQLAQHDVRHTPDFEEIRDRVRLQWIQDRRLEIAKQKAQALAASLSPGKSLKEAAEADSLADYQEVGPIARTGFISGVGSDPVLMGTIFASDTTDVPRALGTERGGFVIKILEKTSAHRDVFEKDLENLRSRALQQRRNEVLTAWLEDLREKADIEDNRRFLFSN